MSIFHGRLRLSLLLTLNSKRSNLAHTAYTIIICITMIVWPELCTVGVNAKVSTKCQYSVVH